MIRAIKSDIIKRIHAKATATAATVPAAPGAYLILIALHEPISLPLPTLRLPSLPAGYYLYAGSARGPGGLRARIARHLRRDKKLHWHVDHLTNAATSLFAFPIPDGRECALVQALVQSDNYHPPLPGFGSSDCKNCISHLLAARPVTEGETQCR
ncbi:MAG: DUF123 domain-containing protein [Alphaproteobacteria bacterium]|nr:DUF123 domain-containing protein [Alphaproteobacteria bacterium]